MTAHEELPAGPADGSDPRISFQVSLGRQLRTWRRRYHLSARVAAEQIGVHPSTIKRWERGAGCPDVYQWDRIRTLLANTDHQHLPPRAGFVRRPPAKAVAGATLLPAKASPQATEGRLHAVVSGPQPGVAAELRRCRFCGLSPDAPSLPAAAGSEGGQPTHAWYDWLWRCCNASACVERLEQMARQGKRAIAARDRAALAASRPVPAVPAPFRWTQGIVPRPAAAGSALQGSGPQDAALQQTGLQRTGTKG